MQILSPHEKVQWGQKDLANGQIVSPQLFPVGANETTLTDRRYGLQSHRVSGTTVAAQTQLGKSGSDRSRRHHDHPTARSPQSGYLVAQLGHHGAVNDALVVGDRRGTDFDHSGIVPVCHQLSS